MKIYIIIIMLSALSLSSCKEWLDIQPEGESTEDQIFNSGNGYRSVLNGLYQSMAGTALYGGDLSFGVLDCMSQQYNLELITARQVKFVAAGAFKYTDVSLASVIENIWESAFNVVANANCLIQNAETASPDLFTKGEMERKMILGEAYACRALMHFDMLRLYAPAPVNDDKKAYVPYVESYPEIQADAIPVEAFLNKVIADLERALTLVIEFDTTALGKSVSASGASRFKNELNESMEGTSDSFFKGRGYRLSYYSITALLARVYQYAGRYDDAFDAAKKVMEFEVKNNIGTVLPLFSKDDYSGVTSTTDFDKKADLKVISNLIFAVYNEKAYENTDIKNWFKKESSGGAKDVPWLIVNSDIQKIFFTSDGLINESGEDYRSVDMIFFANGKYPVSAKWYLSGDEKIRDGNINIMPVIRSTEMRYIMAECYARKSNFVEAQNILNQIRKNRGCKSTVSVGDWNSFIRELICDARREWISEGQLFYLYKRLNADVNFGKNGIRPLSRSEYLVPIPTNQTL